MSLIQRIQSGEFNNTEPYPQSRTEEGYQKNIDAYRNGKYNAIKKFRDAVEYEYGMVGHPKADVLWRICWDNGHAGGYTEVLLWYEDLVRLVK